MLHINNMKAEEMPEDPEELFTTELIEAVRAQPMIYNKRNGAYYNKISKARAWKEVAACTGKDSTSCHKKWKLLRERFTKELRKKLEQPSRSISTSGWSYYDNMMFLKDHVEPKHGKTKGNGNQSDPPGRNMDNESSSTSCDIISPPSKRSTGVDSAIEAYKNTLKVMEERIAATSRIRRMDEADEMFAKTLALHVKDLPESIKNDLKQEMFKMVFDARRKYLKD